MNTVEAIKHLFLQAGAGWVLWLLAALSVASVAIAVERWLHYQRAGGDLQQLAQALHDRLHVGDVSGATTQLSRSETVAGRVAAAGLQLAGRGVQAADKAMQSRLALERDRLERRLAYLGTLGNNAPFIGLFGTVIGVIQAFEELGHGAAGHAEATSAAGQVASQAVMSAIAEALVATAVGISVALPAVAAYNYLQRRVASLLAGTDVLSNLVLAYLSDGTLAKSSRPREAGAAEDL
jgi:biopolymer transport protein ExbB